MLNLHRILLIKFYFLLYLLFYFLYHIIYYSINLINNKIDPKDWKTFITDNSITGYYEREKKLIVLDNTDTIWPGNLTTKHKPKVVYQNGDENYTLYFYFDNSDTDNSTEHFWKINIVENTEFYWDDLYV